MVDYYIFNAHVFVFDPVPHYAYGLAIRHGKIAKIVYTYEEISARHYYDAEGAYIYPGFIDAHCHLKASMSSSIPIPHSVTSVEAFLQFAQPYSSQDWVTFTAYDPARFGPLSKQLLNEIDCPVRVRHVTRHASYFNQQALDRLFVPDMPSVMFQAEEGIYYGADAYISKQIHTELEDSFFIHKIPALEQKLLRYGITSVQDATPNVSQKDKDLFSEWSIDTHFVEKKIVMEQHETVYPDVETLSAMFEQHNHFAIHVVTPEMLWTVLHAFERSVRKPSIRLEHFSLCPEAFLPDVIRHRFHIVTNPSFIYEHGDRYLRNVEKDEQKWLYLVQDLLDSQLIVAAGSDAPVASYNPFQSMYAAHTRRTRTNQLVNGSQRVSRGDMLKMHTIHSAMVGQYGDCKGLLRQGYDADFFMTATDLLHCQSSMLLQSQIDETWINGIRRFNRKDSLHG
ncbi:MAG: amidohydrolase family protein [Lysinibacillus sp.]